MLTPAKNLTFALPMLVAAAAYAQDPTLSVLGTFRAGPFNAGAAEIVSYHAGTRRLFVVNGADKTIDILDASTPSSLRRISQVRIPAEHGVAANSVAVFGNTVAAAIEAAPKTDPGSVLFMDPDGRVISAVKVGALPDMLTFTPDGSKVVVANEGEPNDAYTVDPEGSISIIDMSRGAADVTQADVRTADFRGFVRSQLPPWVRVYGPNATVAQDFEPEYVAITPDSRTAYVTIQEANAMAIVNLDSARVTSIVSLGLKEHWRAENSFDASDRDGGINLRTWTAWGFYLPDAIAAYTATDGNVYLITANEGDTRDYPGYSEEARVADLRLDPTAYPNAAEIQQASDLGRLLTTRANGDTDGDGDIDMIHSIGGRSFSIWNTAGEQVWDSMNHLELINAANLGPVFNASNSNHTFDNRSDDKGPEPEAVTTGAINGRAYAFIANERQSNIVVYDVSEPRNPRFIGQYANRNAAAAPDTAAAGDLGPEGIVFIPANESPTNRPLLVVANEISGTTTVWQIN